MTDRKPQVGETWLYNKQKVEIIGFHPTNKNNVFFRYENGGFNTVYSPHLLIYIRPPEQIAKELVEEANKRVGRSCFEVEDYNNIAVDHFFTIDQFKALLGIAE